MTRGALALCCLLATEATALSAVSAYGTGLRISAGAGLAVDPLFAAASVGVDWFVRPSLGVGVLAAHTVLSRMDPQALEDDFGFAGALLRFRPTGVAPGRLRAELLGGAGLARIRHRSPGAHTEWAPDLVAGAALGWALPARLELALEVTSHVTLGDRTSTRNPPHTSELCALVLRWGE